MAWLFGKKKNNEPKEEVRAQAPAAAAQPESPVQLNRERGNQIAKIIDMNVTKLVTSPELAENEESNRHTGSLRKLKDEFQNMKPIMEYDTKELDKEISDCLKTLNEGIKEQDVKTIGYCVEGLEKAAAVRPNASEEDIVHVRLYMSRSKVCLDITLCQKAKDEHLKTYKEVEEKRDQVKTLYQEAIKSGKDLDELQGEQARLSGYKQQLDSIKTAIDMQDTKMSGFEQTLTTLKVQIDNASAGQMTAEQIEEISELVSKIASEHVATFTDALKAFEKSQDAVKATDNIAKQAIKEHLFATTDPTILASAVSQKQAQEQSAANEEKNAETKELDALLA